MKIMIKISKINALFRRIGELQIQHRYAVLFIFIIITAVCSAGLVKFKIANSSEGWYGSGDQFDDITMLLLDYKGTGSSVEKE